MIFVFLLSPIILLFQFCTSIFCFSHASSILLSFSFLIHFLFCFIFLCAHCFLCYSSPTLSLPFFSHSAHSHASTILTLPHSSFFPFSRFSLTLFYYLSILYGLTPSLLIHSSYTFVLLFSIASICISFLILFSFQFERDSRVSRYQRRGWTRTDWWRLSSVARGCKKRGMANRTVVGASIVTVLNERPWQSVSFPAIGARGTRQFYQFISILVEVWPTRSQRPFCFLNATRSNRQRDPTRSSTQPFAPFAEPDVFSRIVLSMHDKKVDQIIIHT